MKTVPIYTCRNGEISEDIIGTAAIKGRLSLGEATNITDDWLIYQTIVVSGNFMPILAGIDSPHCRFSAKITLQ
jgi:hypothetical protein